MLKALTGKYSPLKQWVRAERIGLSLFFKVDGCSRLIDLFTDTAAILNYLDGTPEKYVVKFSFCPKSVRKY